MPDDAPRDTSPAAVIAALCARDPSLSALGISVITAVPDGAELQLTVSPSMCNGVGVCHGGMIFALADTSIAFAANSGNEATVVASAQIEFVAPAHAGDVLTATSQRRWSQGRTALWDVTVAGPHQQVVALAHGRTRSLGTSVVA